MWILSFIQLAPKSIPCFWPIFTNFQNEVFSSNLNILANINQIKVHFHKRATNNENVHLLKESIEASHAYYSLISIGFRNLKIWVNKYETGLDLRFLHKIFTNIFVPLTTPKLAVHTKILKFQLEFLATETTENNLLMKVHNDLIVGQLAFPSIKEIFL